MSTATYLPNVVTLKLDSAACTGCGFCLTVCPHEVFALRNGKAEIVRRDACMECGACALNCPAEALAVRAGVGCASAVLTGWRTGGEPTCDCSGDSGASCCG